PTQNLVAGGASPLPIAALALGTILASLLALSTYLFQTARGNARDLKRTNERLVSDIARRYHVEQELRESESRTSLIINAVKDCAIYMLDTEGRVASWNPGAQTLNGYTAAEIIGKHFSELYPSDRKSSPKHFPRRRLSNTNSGCAAQTAASDRSSATAVRITTCRATLPAT